MARTRREFTFEDGDKVWAWTLKKGFRTLYITAPYYWGVADPEHLKIVQFTEGDVDITVAEDKKDFSNEIKKIQDWMNENNSDAAIEMNDTVAKMKKLKEVI